LSEHSDHAEMGYKTARPRRHGPAAHAFLCFHACALF
jgi:hypothetical protein